MLGFTLIAGFDLVLFFTLRMIYEIFSKGDEQRKRKPGHITEENERKVNNWIDRHHQAVCQRKTGIWNSKKTFVSKPRY